MAELGTMRCPQGTVVSYDRTKIESEEKRCPGVGPVSDHPSKKHVLVVQCPECGPIQMARDIWGPRVN